MNSAKTHTRKDHQKVRITPSGVSVVKFDKELVKQGLKALRVNPISKDHQILPDSECDQCAGSGEVQILPIDIKGISNKKVFIMTTSGRNFQVDAHEVIQDRCNYYFRNDPDISYEEEYWDLEGDDNSITEWLFDNMKWQKCKTLIELPTDCHKLSSLEVDDYGVK